MLEEEDAKTSPVQAPPKSPRAPPKVQPEAQTKVQPSGDAALTYFATGTYFKDFGDDLKSTFTVTSTGAQQSLVSENLDGFGELSFGVNYTKIMSGQGALPARQMDASIRADTRFSDQLDSWGLTAQVRLQF